MAGQDVSTSNPFDALNTVEKEDEREQLEESDDEIEELDDDTARYTSFTNRTGGGANDADLLEDKDFDLWIRGSGL
ncbi:hypothetical protein Tco_1547663 [Tanacetum coccineum]